VDKAIMAFGEGEEETSGEDQDGDEDPDEGEQSPEAGQ
jgi:hypothetical protein